MGFLYWLSITAFGISLRSDSARPRLERGESWGASVGVRITSAPGVWEDPISWVREGEELDAVGRGTELRRSCARLAGQPLHSDLDIDTSPCSFSDRSDSLHNSVLT